VLPLLTIAGCEHRSNIAGHGSSSVKTLKHDADHHTLPVPFHTSERSYSIIFLKMASCNHTCAHDGWPHNEEVFSAEYKQITNHGGVLFKALGHLKGVFEEHGIDWMLADNLRFSLGSQDVILQNPIPWIHTMLRIRSDDIFKVLSGMDELVSPPM